MKEIKRYHENGPYDKFLSHGPKSLSKAELLAIILRTGTKEYSAVELGEQILKLAGEENLGLNGLHHVTLDELKSIKGIGQIKAVKIRCLTEFAMRMGRECAAKRLSFNSPHTVAEYYKESLRHNEREEVILLLLDSRLTLIKEFPVSLGTVNASLLSPREIFIEAVKEKAVYVMLLHNHPSGDPMPSENDMRITKQVKEAGQLLEIPLLDHIIIGDNSFYSYKENETL
ncbi:MAG: DNA repair protein RadC [Lachnospiraceae bacterium]|nr:DNA repair protein RadC [Lachnospiraceae bacterium]